MAKRAAAGAQAPSIWDQVLEQPRRDPKGTALVALSVLGGFLLLGLLVAASRRAPRALATGPPIAPLSPPPPPSPQAIADALRRKRELWFAKHRFEATQAAMDTIAKDKSLANALKSLQAPRLPPPAPPTHDEIVAQQRKNFISSLGEQAPSPQQQIMQSARDTVTSATEQAWLKSLPEAEREKAQRMSHLKLVSAMTKHMSGSDKDTDQQIYRIYDYTRHQGGGPEDFWSQDRTWGGLEGQHASAKADANFRASTRGKMSSDLGIAADALASKISGSGKAADPIP